MFEIIRSIKKEILWRLPKTIAHRYLYYRHLNKKLNLKKPQDFNEKIQYLILNNYGEKERNLTDKILVRDYVVNMGYKDILPEIYAIYNEANEIDWNELPNQFVLKTNNGSGGVIICTDKAKLNFEESIKLLDKQIKRNFAKELLEYHYNNIKPRILCEQYINDGSQKNPKDYKIYCFDGKPKCILLCTDREKKVKIDYYDLNWNRLDYAKKEYCIGETCECPKNLNEMLKIAEDLSKGMKFVRIDLYNQKGKIYFSELTFTPAAGMIYNITDEAQRELGEYLKL